MKIYETLDSGIKIVEYEHLHAPSLAEFWNICGQEDDDDWGGESGISTAGQIISQHETASHFNVYIALDGNDVVGYCSFGRYYYDADTLYVSLLGVRPDYRGKKIGKALVLLCVQRTIELNYPRLDLFTWGGNTAAVPLYKKCGFLWEDRSDGTHFVNFMPTILTAPIFAKFFKKADWYADSNRSLEIIPDGKKVNGFELFGYSWEKDGDTLKIGYERSGRQMRMIETQDYKIELTAQDHELAFGTDYECKFIIENKTGKELNVKINGRQDKNIKLDCEFDMQIAKGKQEIPAKFYVGAMDEPQDPWKVHPCLLAGVEINGQAVTFGLGINAKFPLLVKFNRECLIDQVGMEVKTHISIQSALPENATVAFSIPKNKILQIQEEKNTFALNVPAKGKASVYVPSTTLAVGYEKLELNCAAVCESGKKINFAAPAFIFTRDMTHAFSGEDLSTHSIFNGPWKLTFDKTENEVGISHLVNKNYSFSDAFMPPKFGKPYDDEFNLIKPNIKTYAQEGAMVMETEFVSAKFPGLVVTQVYTLYATGVITRFNKVENRDHKPRKAMLQDNYGLALGFNSVFSYHGKITQNHETGKLSAALYGFDNISPEGFDENWVYEDSPSASKGYCWPMEYKSSIKWGSYMSFEIDMNELLPRQIYETKPVTFTLGLFTNYNDMRNYARQLYNQSPAPTVKPMEVMLNGYNPFAANSKIKLEIINNRDQVQEGTITVSSENMTEAVSQTNPHEDVVEQNSFELELNSTDISVVSIAMSMVGYEKITRKAIFFPKGEVSTSQENTVYSVSNGTITFKADPNYSQGCFSLTDSKGQEWLLNQYPEHKPFSWFNPFIGGIHVRHADMDERAMLKEKISVEFTELNDNFGNLWKGICVTLSISEDENLKGSVYKTFFLTQPGLPVLCTFFQFENNTGEYKNDRTWLSACLKPDEDAKKITVETTDSDGNIRKSRMGSLDTPDFSYEGTAVISSSRNEKLYCLCCSKNTEYPNDYWGSNKLPVMVTLSHTKASAASGETFTSNPAFIVLTEKVLPKDALSDLEKVRF